jgi:putative nucleotidyltransferase with HDIG domain
MLKEQIELYVKDINKLPPMSDVVIKVVSLIKNPDVDMQELASEILKDPAITASLLKLSNSAYYRASKPIRTVQEALMTLGTKTVKEMVILSASKSILNQELRGYQLDADSLWLQSLVVAELSHKIALDKKLNVDKDLIFTAGLLHSIGKVILSQFFPRVIVQIKSEIKNKPQNFCEIEKKFFGYTHQEISKLALETWNFPEELKEAVGFYHEPEKATKFPILASIVHVAHTIAVVSGIGIDIGGLSHELSSFALRTTNITEEDLQKYYIYLPEIEKSISDLKNP